jgi:hypothetical protein
VPDSAGCQLLDAFGVDTEDLARAADQLAFASQADAGPAAAEPPGQAPERIEGAAARRRAGFLSAAESHDRLVARIEELATQREALGTAIRRFAHHDETCHPERGCSCGLQVVLDGLAPPAQGGVRPAE